MSHTKIANKLQNLKSSAIRELLKHSKMDGVISLGGGIPDPNLFDREGLQIAMDHILTHGWEDAFQYGLSEGNPELRAAICQIMLDRGIHCGVENVVVTSGSQQSLDILARALINPGDVVVLERPTYLAALQVFQLAEANLLSVGTDAEGMIVDELETLLLSTRIKAVYIVPTFGNPGGVSLAEQRRKQLVELIAKWFEEREEVEQVLHPALPSCPGHEIWKRDFTGSSGLFSVVLKPHYSKESVEKFIDSLQYFGIGFSWGGFESLAIPFNPRKDRPEYHWPYEGHSFRLQIGLEDPVDLVRDLDQALRHLKG
ncbi:aminotransferase class I/II-fold pyridoxal phosphate-dependent enzyme [Klebsiella pneumoniae]